MQQKENFAFQGRLTVQKGRFDLVQWVKHAAKTQLRFQEILTVQRERFDLVKWVNHAPKRELHFLGDIDCIERKVGPCKMG